MGERVTIVLDDDVLKKLREFQARRIRESAKSVSFSRIINEVVIKGLKSK